MIKIQGGGTISGFTLFESGIYHDSIYVDENKDKTATVKNCAFMVDKDCRLSSFINIRPNNTLTIQNCTFYCGNGYVIYAERDTDVLIDSCNFKKGNYFGWPFIATYGNTEIERCSFSAEVGYITCATNGVITISDCDFEVNYHNEKIYPNIYIPGSQLALGTLNILDGSIDGEGYYDLYTGQKIELPLSECTELSVLAYMTDEQATTYFAIENHLGPFDLQYDEMREIMDDEPDDDDNDEDTPSEQPQEPGDQTEGEDTTDEDQPPQEPTQPPEGEGTDNPGNASDQDTSQGPQEPPDSDNGKEDDYTPPTDHKPSQRPTRSSTDNKKPADTNQPQDEAAPAKKLVCGEARIDTSRTIVLLGYGDGQQHEDEPLTRAQLATIIYRLLDDKSIAIYSNAELAFVDVAADAWYAPYVRVIQAAGIVNGVGSGKYDPNGTVTWAQIVTVLSRFVEPQEYVLQHIQYSGWAHEAIQTAVALGWLEDSADFTPDAIISRGELVQFVNSVLGLYRA